MDKHLDTESSEACREVRPSLSTPDFSFKKHSRGPSMHSHIHCRARDKEKGTICALKKIKMDKHQDGFPLTSIREINILLSFHHPNIVEVRTS